MNQTSLQEDLPATSPRRGRLKTRDDAASPTGESGAITYERADIETIIGNPRNNNLHPDDQIEMLKASIELFGQPRPVLARKANRMLIAGHGIFEAMRKLHLPQIEVAFWDIDQATADNFLVADNRLAEHSHLDADRTRALLEEVPEDLYAALGFSAKDVEDLLQAPTHGGITAIQEIDTAALVDRFWITVRGPLAQQAHALKRLQELMGDLADVEVELGTIE